MDKNELGSQAEKYKREMMRLYGRSTSAPEANENSANDAADRRVQQTEADRYPDDVFDSSIAAPDNKVLRRNTSPAGTDMLQDYNDRYPEPDLSELESDYGEIPDPENIEPPAYFDEQSLGSSKGFIQVNVRTGDESGTVPNATVMVTAVVDGNRVIFAAGLTNRNGTTRKFEVPVPAPEYSLSPDSDVRPYSLFDVSVTAAGFFNSRSVDVPVFSGVTSIQNFNMIPVPLFMDSSDETVTYFNQEPNFRDPAVTGG